MNYFDEAVEQNASEVFTLLMSDKVKDAIVISEQHLHKDIHHPYFLFTNAISFLADNSLDEFNQHFQQLKKSSDITSADLHNFGLFFQRHQLYQLAAECFGESITLKPDFCASYTELGKIFISLENYDGAIRSFSAAYQIAPENVEILTNLGLCMEKQYQFSEAKELYKNGVKLFPLTSKLHIRLARCLHILGENEEAFEILMSKEEYTNIKEGRNILFLLYQDLDNFNLLERIKIERKITILPTDYRC